MSQLILASSRVTQHASFARAARIPLTKNLQHAFLMSADATDAVTKKRLTRLSENTSFRPTATGLSLNLDTNLISDKVILTNPYRPGSSDFTVSISLTFLREAVNVDSAVACVRFTGPGSAQNEWFISGNQGGNTYIPGFCVYSGTTLYTVYDTVKRNVGIPVSLTAVKKGTTLLFYRDGKLVNTASGPAAINVSTESLRIGSYYPGDITYCLNADIHVFGVWSRALSATEVKTLSDNPWQLFEPQNSVVYLGSGIGSSAIDLSGNATATASASGTLTQQLDISGASIATATATGVVNQTIALSGAATSVSVANGAVTITTSLSGSAQSSASASAAFLGEVSLAGSAQSQATASGGMTQSQTLTGVAQAVASANGALNLSINMSGAAIASALASANLDTGGSGLSGAASAQASASGSMGSVIGLTGQAQAVAVSSGGLTNALSLSGAAASVVAGTGDVTVAFGGLSGSALASALASGTVSLSLTLDGHALLQAIAQAQLSILGDYIIPAGRYKIRNITPRLSVRVA